MNERYHTPKELSYVLAEEGIDFQPRYYRAIRRYGAAIGDSPFCGPVAAPSEIKSWLQRHPEFQVRMGESRHPQPTAGFASL